MSCPGQRSPLRAAVVNRSPKRESVNPRSDCSARIASSITTSATRSCQLNQPFECFLNESHAAKSWFPTDAESTVAAPAEVDSAISTTQPGARTCPELRAAIVAEGTLSHPDGRLRIATDPQECQGGGSLLVVTQQDVVAAMEVLPPTGPCPLCTVPTQCFGPITLVHEPAWGA
jgi:hypothetical protein